MGTAIYCIYNLKLVFVATSKYHWLPHQRFILNYSLTLSTAAPFSFISIYEKIYFPSTISSIFFALAVEKL